MQCAGSGWRAAAQLCVRAHGSKQALQRVRRLSQLQHLHRLWSAVPGAALREDRLTCRTKSALPANGC